MESMEGVSLRAAIDKLTAQERDLETALNDVRASKQLLENAEQIARATLGFPESDFTDDQANSDELGFQEPEVHPLPEDKPLRARIGDKRYLMLIAIRNFGLAGADRISVATALETRHINQQMGSDEELGVVKSDQGQYSLTDKGTDLLRRYEEYRGSAGKDLPKLPEAAYPAQPNGETHAFNGVMGGAA